MTSHRSKPNVVLIMADQLRFDALGRFTPNINRLREESFSFERAYCASPLCVPARGSFFTGMYPNETGCIINGWEKQDESFGKVNSGIPSLYELLQDEWDVWHTGKQHLHYEKPIEEIADQVHWHPLEGNYDRHLKMHGIRKPGGTAFRGLVPEMALGTTTRARNYSLPTTGCFEPGYEFFYDGYITQTSLDAIRGRDRSKPMALSAMYLAPHPPLDVPEPWFSRWSEQDIELPENVGVWSKDQSPLQLYNLTGAIGTRYTREQWKEIWRVYLGLVSLLDDSVGMLIEELKVQGIYDDTLIIFTSDHGEMLGSHRLWQKMCMYEESVRTPLMFKLPKSQGVMAGKSDALVSSIDVFPTLCDALGIEAPQRISGWSLMPLIRRERRSVRDQVYIQFDGNGARGNYQRCVIEGDDKLIVDLFKDELYIELYRVSEDVQEQRNLAFDGAERRRIEHLLELLRGHMRDTGDLLTIQENAYIQFISKYLSFHR
jgi:arylsulfatase A-like enzyme